MPPLEHDNLCQTAIKWSKTGYDKFGNETVGAYSELAVRWEYVQSEALDKQGNTISLDATVVTREEVNIGDQMWLGTSEDWLGTGSEGNESNVMYVVTQNVVPDLKNRNTRYNLGLKFFMDTPAT